MGKNLLSRKVVDNDKQHTPTIFFQSMTWSSQKNLEKQRENQKKLLIKLSNQKDWVEDIHGIIEKSYELKNYQCIFNIRNWITNIS